MITKLIEKIKQKKALPKNKNDDNSRLLDTTIKESDDHLMVVAKTTLNKLQITVNDFKSLFDNVSEMNNIRREIEHGHTMTLSRFSYIMDKLGCSFHMVVELPNGKGVID